MKNLLTQLKFIQKNKKGLTLTELMVTISIIMTATSIGSGQYDSALSAARDANRLANVRQVQTALDIYNISVGQYPECGENQTATALCYENLKNYIEPEYMPEMPDDPLNDNEYTYKYYSDGNSAWIEFETEDTEDQSPRKFYGSF